jgi:hypothetical protein
MIGGLLPATLYPMSDNRESLLTIPRPTAIRWLLLGLAAAAAGLLVQWAAAPAVFPGFPTGVLFLLGAGAVVWLDRRSPWAPAGTALLALFVGVDGLGGGRLSRTLGSGNPVLLGGLLVLLAGLLISVAAAALAVTAARRRATRQVRPLSAANPQWKATAFTAFGLCAAATADAFGQGLHWDRPSALVLPLIAVLVLTVPGRHPAVLAAVTSAAFLYCALAADLSFHAFTAPAQPGDLVFPILQLAGYTANLIGATALALTHPTRPSPLPTRETHPLAAHG